MATKCENCGKEFEPKRTDAKFCSPACKQAHYRKTEGQKNLYWRGELIRGQHENDVVPTGLGIIRDKCRNKDCGKEFSRWMESKLARLVRSEVEGSIHWDTRNFDHQKFDELKAIRMEEVKFCSDECQQKGASPGVDYVKQYPVTPEDAVQHPETPENGVDHAPKRRGA